jgi:CHAD domain-containing protein
MPTADVPLTFRFPRMIQKGKWIEIHSPDEAAADVAARTLDGRLRLVAHYLPLAAGAADDDEEHVHQTRVSTRRAMTTLSIFEHLLAGGEAKWFRKKLKRVRKAANDARDFDVLAERLSERLESGGDDPACEKLVAWIHDQRREAQQPIRKMAASLDKKRYKRRAKKLVKRLRKRNKRDDSGTFGQLANSRMRELVGKFIAFEQQPLRDLETLHRFRVCGKHLRYAMEVFAGAFDRRFREELYPQIEALQDQLGKINDHAVARERFEAWLAEADDEGRRALLRELIDDEAAALSRLQDQFLEEWTHDRAQGLRQRFLDELSPEHSVEGPNDAQSDPEDQVLLGGLVAANPAPIEPAEPLRRIGE